MDENRALPDASSRGGQPDVVDLAIPRREVVVVERDVKYPALILVAGREWIAARFGVRSTGLCRCIERYLVRST